MGGLNFSLLHDPFDAALFVQGMRYTLWLSAASIAGSFAVGALGAWLQFAGGRCTRRAVAAYIAVFRNTPPLVQLYFFYFALGPSLSALVHGAAHPQPLLGNVTWAIVSLTLYAGAFNIEIFRAGIEAVPAATREAAEALGLNPRQTFRHIILPLACRTSMAGLNNNLVNLIKTTTNAFAIAVPEVLYAASQIWSEHFNTLEMMLVLLAFYMLLVGLFSAAMQRAERRLAVPGWGQA